MDDYFHWFDYLKGVLLASCVRSLVSKGMVYTDVTYYNVSHPLPTLFNRK